MAAPFHKTDKPTPLLAPWGSLAPRIVELVHAHPDLTPRLLLMPARGLHATSVALHVAAEQGKAIDITAAHLRSTSPRNLLRVALPEASPNLYRLLDRVTTPAWPLGRYRALDAVLRSPVASLLLEATTIGPSDVAHAEGFLRADPLLWRARKACRYPHEREHLTTVIEVLRRLELLDELAGLPDGAGRQSVSRRVEADLGRAQAPAGPVQQVGRWRQVTSVGDLWRIGRRLRLCVRPGQWGSSGYAIGLLTGRDLFLHHPVLDALAHLRHVTGDLWTVTQMARVRNAEVAPPVRSEFEAGLSLAGLRLVPSSVSDALHSILSRGRLDGLDGTADEEINEDEAAGEADVEDADAA